jgi:preprotein translocase subunit YajC
MEGRPAAAEPPFLHVGGPMIASVVAQNQTGGTLQLVLTLALMVGIFYFLLIRPQQRRARQQRDLVQSLDVGDEVVTIGGIHGVIVEIDEDEVTLDVGGGTRIRFVKQAVARKRVLEDEVEEEEADEET